MERVKRSNRMPNEASLDEFALKMTPAVRKAAEIALGLEGRVSNTPKGHERTAVKQALTEADTLAQEAILEALLEHYPHVRLEAEEDTPLVEAFRCDGDGDGVVIIDPIDGTLQSYLEGLGPYAVIVGLSIERRVHSALVMLPREGFLFRTAPSAGVEVIAGAAPPRPARAASDGRKILVSHSVPQRTRAALESEGFEVAPAAGGAVAIAPLLPGVRAGIRYAAEESGIGISIRGRVGVAIAREAGAFVRAEGGQPFPDDLDTPCRLLSVTANEKDQEALQRILEGEA